jgi:preprotein translocase subunit YajC
MSAGLLLPLVVLVGMYFLMIRPQQRKVRAREAMVRSAGVGDDIATAGGVLGTIVAFEGDDIVVVEVDTDVELRIQRRAIGELYVQKPQPDSDTDELEHEGPVSDA